MIAVHTAPERGDGLIRAHAQRTGVPAGRIRIAVRYYAEYPAEIDRFLIMVEAGAEQLEGTLEVERRLLG